MRLIDLQEALLEIRKAMADALAQFENLSLAHDKMYSASIGLSPKPEAQLTLRQVALVFDLPIDEVVAVTTRKYEEISFSANEFGQMTLSCADAKRLFAPVAETANEVDSLTVTSNAVQYLLNVPGVADLQIAVALGITQAQLEGLKSRIEAERSDLTDRMLSITIDPDRVHWGNASTVQTAAE